MVESDIENRGDPPLKDMDVVLSYMGSGASHIVFAGDIRKVIEKISEKRD